MVVEIMPARMAFVPILVHAMRETDRQELAALGINPTAALTQSLANSTQAWAGFIDHKMVCMFGVAKVSISDIGMPWMMGTDLIETYDRVFLRRCRAYLNKMFDGNDLLANYVDTRNASAVKWLRWLGFEFGEAEPHGVNGEMFYPFWKRKA